MKANQSKHILDRIATVSGDIAELRRVRMEIASGGTASASLSAGGGSKSYTRLDLGSVTSLIRSMESELASLRAHLTGAPIRRIQFIREGW